MKKIGLTGGIGSGKSTIGRVFKALGISIYNSDKEAKFLIQTDNNIKDSLISIFGDEVFLKEEYNKEFISQQVFDDKEKLRQLNSVVHPAVQKHFDNWCELQRSNGSPYLIKEAAILFESGAYQGLNKTVTVNAPEALRTTRVMNRDGFNFTEIKKIMNHQLTDSERSSRADYVIDNSGNKLVTPQVIALDNIFRKS